MIEEFLNQALTHRTGPAAIFAGAGISVSSGLPDYFRFSSHLLGQLTSISDQGLLESLARQIQPEILLQVLFEEYGSEVMSFFDWFDNGETNANHKFIARWIEAGNIVFTSNIDNLVEKACDESGVHYARFCTDESYSELCKDGFGGFKGCEVFKLHGSIDKSSEVRRVTAYDRVQFSPHQVGKGLTDEKREVFEHALKELDFVFMGYSASDRFSIQPIIRRVNTSRNIFWICHSEHATEYESQNWDALDAQREQMIRRAVKSGNYSLLDWELISLLQIAEKKKEQILRWTGNVDQLIARVGSADDINMTTFPLANRDYPLWSRNISVQQKNITAAKLFAKVSLDKEAKRFALRVAENGSTVQQARARQVLGVLDQDLPPAEAHEFKLRNLETAIAGFESCGQLAGSIECSIEKANLLRQKNQIDLAMETLEDVENTITDEAKSAILDPNIRHCQLTRVHYLRGLAGLQGYREGVDLLRTIGYCDEAIGHAHQSGNKDLLAEALNAKALIITKLFEEPRLLLLSAVDVLDEALEIDTGIGDLDGCYKQYRNLGLAHNHLAELAKNAKNDTDRNRHREEAVKNFRSARKILVLSPKNTELKDKDLTLRSAQSYIDLNPNKAVELAIGLRARFQEAQDWHGEARTIHVLLLSESDTDKLRDHIRALIEIYQKVVESDGERNVLLSRVIKVANALDFLDLARSKARSIQDDFAETIAGLNGQSRQDEQTQQQLERLEVARQSWEKLAKTCLELRDAITRLRLEG